MLPPPLVPSTKACFHFIPYRNGEYLGPAFIDVPELRLVPMVRLRASGTEISANFGQRPFACPPTADLAEKDSEMVRKLREDQEANKRRIREAEDAKLAAREEQVRTTACVSCVVCVSAEQNDWCRPNC